jgi:pimeloyl-ACP methyl ester carboxylesterase
MKVVLIPGIHTEAVSCVERLIPFLTQAGFTTIFDDYGFILGLETKLANPLVWRSVLPFIEPETVIVGHSNGAAIGYDLMNAGAKVKGCVFINGALDPRITRAVGVDFIDVYYNPGDEITEVAELAERLDITDPIWGQMGHAGYWGSDPLITSINCGATPGMPVVDGHSAFFEPDNIKAWGPFLAQRLTKAVSGPST